MRGVTFNIALKFGRVVVFLGILFRCLRELLYVVAAASAPKFRLVGFQFGIFLFNEALSFIIPYVAEKPRREKSCVASQTTMLPSLGGIVQFWPLYGRIVGVFQSL